MANNAIKWYYISAGIHWSTNFGGDVSLLKFIFLMIETGPAQVQLCTFIETHY